MPERRLPVLRHHRVPHLAELRVAPALFDARFPAGCSTARCDSSCCRNGVYADRAERDRILANAEMIRRHMTPQMEADPERWFDPEARDDADYPSGQAFGTEVKDGHCVFLLPDRRCVLQKAALDEGLAADALKPFFCFAFPITIERGELTVEPPARARNRGCCVAEGGPLDVLDALGAELDVVVPPEGIAELRALRDALEA